MLTGKHDVRVVQFRAVVQVPPRVPPHIRETENESVAAEVERLFIAVDTSQKRIDRLRLELAAIKILAGLDRATTII